MKNILSVVYVPLVSWFCLLGATAKADYEDGVEAAFAGDFDTAFKEFSIAAQEGLSLAQYNLGILYFTGQGVEQDFNAAFEWTKRAAEQGHLNAQFNLGSLYLDGQGTQVSVLDGINWFTKAAKNGHANSAYTLAKMYQDGDFVSSDPVQAHAWAAQSEINEHPEASSLKEEIEKNLSAEEIRQARRTLATWQIE